MYCEEGTQCEQDDLPPPPMFITQVKTTLETLGVKQVCCEYEADPAMALDSYQNGSLVLANDSDFLFFNGCKYVSFETGIECKEEGGAGVRIPRARIMTRAGFAQHVDVPESLLVEWGIFLGNDFTGPLLRGNRHAVQKKMKRFFILPRERSSDGDGDGEDDVSRPLEHDESDGPEMSDPELILEMLDTALSSSDSMLGSSKKNDSLSIAILFSRAYYNYGNTDVFEDDQPEDEEDEEDTEEGKEENKEENKGDDKEEEHLLSFSTLNQEFAQDPAILIGPAVLTEMIQEMDELDESMCDALARMHNGERQYYEEDGAGGMPDLELVWKDVQIAYFYQRGCKTLMSKMKRLASSSSSSSSSSSLSSSSSSPPSLSNPRNAPEFLFHGPTFHKIRREQRDEYWQQFAEEENKETKRQLEDPEQLEEKQDQEEEEEHQAHDTLPIDDHKERILSHIASHRVTIIQGETGCGKSSRIPVLLIEGGGESSHRLKMFVSQPRRIAATTLKRRVSEVLGSRVGLRLGNGIRDESRDTQVWYCTAGYLSRLAAHHPETFATHTHLIIDEIHERSVDTDLLCYMTRRLLEMHPKLRLVVMSATLNTMTYARYFGIPENEYLFVGARRFPLAIHHLDDMSQMKGGTTKSRPPTSPSPDLLPHHLVAAASKLAKHRVDVLASVNMQYSKSQIDLAFDLSRHVGTPGRSVLIFVSGIAHITELVEKFQEIRQRGGRRNNYVVVPIHSDIPFEDQMTAFDPATRREGDDEDDDNTLPIKIVVATNSAESSITLPDCDHVICLGTAKRVEYNPKFHRIQLVHRFISKAGCNQRAGRTGRVRPGTVWRLYTKQLNESMDEFDPPEIQQTPLENVILSLKSSLQCPVVPVLENVISPPDLSHLSPAFSELHRMRYIESSSDEAALTEDGMLAAALGLDLKTTQVVLFGIRVGIPREAVAVAAALSMDKLPFRVTSPFVHTPSEMAEITSSVIRGMSFFDGGMYSTPLMLVRLLFWYRHGAGRRARAGTYKKYGLVASRVKHLHTACRGIEMKMTRYVPDFNQRELCDLTEHPRVQSLARIVLCWSFYQNIFRMDGKLLKPSMDPDVISLAVRGDALTPEVVASLLGTAGVETTTPHEGAAGQFEGERDAVAAGDCRHWRLLGSEQIIYVPHFDPGAAPTTNDWCTFVLDPTFDQCELLRLETLDVAPTIFALSASAEEKKDDDEEEEGEEERTGNMGPMHQALQSLFGTPAARNIQMHENYFHSYTLPRKLTKTQKKRLKEIEDGVESIVYVRDEGEHGRKAVRVKNVEEMSEDFLCDYFDGVVGVSSSKTAGKTIIQCRHPRAEQQSRFTSSSSSSPPSSSSSSSSLFDPSTPLLRDIPLQARNLLMLASYDRRGIIKYPTLTTRGVVGAATSTQPTKEFDQIRVSTPYRARVTFIQGSDDSHLDVDDSGGGGGGGGGGGPSVRTIMERASLISVSHHMTTSKKESCTFGVASAIMAIGESGDCVVMQQCTLTPPGRSFLHRSLACVREGRRVELSSHDDPLTDEEERYIRDIAQELRGDDDSSDTLTTKTWCEFVDCVMDVETPTLNVDPEDIFEEDLYYFNVITGEFVYGSMFVEHDLEDVEFMGRRSSNDAAYFYELQEKSNEQWRREEEKSDGDSLIGRLEKLFQLPPSRPFSKVVNEDVKEAVKLSKEEKRKEKAKSEKKKKNKAKLKEQKKAAKTLQPAQLMAKLAKKQPPTGGGETKESGSVPAGPTYRCPDCLMDFSKWGKCLKHLKESGHAGIECRPSNTCSPGAKCLFSSCISCADSRAEIQQQCATTTTTPSKAKYRCPDCLMDFSKWGKCLKHLKQQHPGFKLKGAINRCAIKTTKDMSGGGGGK